MAEKFVETKNNIYFVVLSFSIFLPTNCIACLFYDFTKLNRIKHTFSSKQNCKDTFLFCKRGGGGLCHFLSFNFVYMCNILDGSAYRGKGVWFVTRRLQVKIFADALWSETSGKMC